MRAGSTLRGSRSVHQGFVAIVRFVSLIRLPKGALCFPAMGTDRTALRSPDSLYLPNVQQAGAGDRIQDTVPRSPWHPQHDPTRSGSSRHPVQALSQAHQEGRHLGRERYRNVDRRCPLNIVGTKLGPTDLMFRGCSCPAQHRHQAMESQFSSAFMVRNPACRQSEDGRPSRRSSCTDSRAARSPRKRVLPTPGSGCGHR